MKPSELPKVETHSKHQNLHSEHQQPPMQTFYGFLLPRSPQGGSTVPSASSAVSLGWLVNSDGRGTLPTSPGSWPQPPCHGSSLGLSQPRTAAQRPLLQPRRWGRPHTNHSGIGFSRRAGSDASSWVSPVRHSSRREGLHPPLHKRGLYRTEPQLLGTPASLHEASTWCQELLKALGKAAHAGGSLLNEPLHRLHWVLALSCYALSLRGIAAGYPPVWRTGDCWLLGN